MIDPNDPGTLDLVAACEEPLSGAERARQRGRELGQTLLVRHMTDAFLTCHIPVKLLY